MARSFITDPLQINKFWLMDVSFPEPAALPIFTPLLGFSGISVPDISLEVQDIRQANALFPSKVVKFASVEDITLTRASTFYDADFYRWIMATVMGNTGSGLGSASFLSVGGPSPRRNLLLIQFFRVVPGQQAGQQAAQGVIDHAAYVSSPFSAALKALNAAAKVLGSFGPFEISPRIPAKAWLLHGCIPTRYKPSQDFDATSGEVSLMELTLAVEGMEEISLAGI